MDNLINSIIDLGFTDMGEFINSGDFNSSEPTTGDGDEILK
jgi:hypothetical protein